MADRPVRRQRLSEQILSRRVNAANVDVSDEALARARRSKSPLVRAVAGWLATTASVPARLNRLRTITDLAETSGRSLLELETDDFAAWREIRLTGGLLTRRSR